MDSHQTPIFGFNDQGYAYYGHARHVLGDQPQEASDLADFYTSNRMTLPADGAHNVSMEVNDVGNQAAPRAIGVQAHIERSRRNRSDQLDWDRHKAQIKNLYLDQNKSLEETKEVMEQLYSFKASKKLYKTKFKEWDWQKNLPTEKAAFMSEKANQRKREQNKDTVFSFGGRLWDKTRVESTLSRANKSVSTGDKMNAATPEGISYETPKAPLEATSADHDEEDSDVEMIAISDDDSRDDAVESAVVKSSKSTRLPLTWRGQSITNLQDMWRTALESRNASRLDEAEDLLCQVCSGLEEILGITNEDTVKAAYNLADLYATSGRMETAIDLVEKTIQNHLETYEYEDRRTQQNVLQAVELLNSWNRQADALGLLSLSQEILHSSSHTFSARKINRRARRGKDVQKRSRNISRKNISSTIEFIGEDLTPARLEYGLEVARNHIAAKDQAAEGLLIKMIFQCEGKSGLSIQCLKAYAGLLKLYDKLDQAMDHELEFHQALTFLTSAWQDYEWEEDKIECIDFMEAGLQLAANLLKSGYRAQANEFFCKAAEKATEVFGNEDERTIWVLITIGLVYQTRMTWLNAQDWFERAFAAALGNTDFGRKDGITRSLQNALDHQHFSYVSDEGRPFKTVFGVSGIKIMPGRLHLE